MRHLIVMMLLAAATPAPGAQIYECVDANGKQHFANIKPEAADCKPLNVSPPASGPDAQLRETAAEMQAVEQVTTWLSATREDSTARREALEDWPSDPQQNVDVLTHALTDPDESVRMRAQQLLEDALKR